MNKKTIDNLMLAMMAAPVVVFVLFALTMGLPDQSYFSINEFYLQTAETIVTILSVPALLWLIRRDRIKEPDKIISRNGMTRYQLLMLIRMFMLMFQCLVLVALYFVVPNASFFYLAVIVYLSMFFARQ